MDDLLTLPPETPWWGYLLLLGGVGLYRLAMRAIDLHDRRIGAPEE